MEEELLSSVTYFAYGSNMSKKQIIDRGIIFSKASPAILKDYKLVFNKKSKHYPGTSFANIEKSFGSIVEGMIYKIDFDSVKKLDKSEGVPNHYQKAIVGVDLKDGTREFAMTYVANPNMIDNSLLPRKSYVDKFLIDGNNFLSKDYIKLLEDTKVADE